MDKRDKKYLEARLESWGEWAARSLNIMSYPQRNPIVQLIEYRTRVTGGPRIDILPVYKRDEWNNATDFCLDQMCESYWTVAYFDYCWHHVDTGETPARRKLKGNHLYDKCKMSKSTFFDCKKGMFDELLVRLSKFRRKN